MEKKLGKLRLERKNEALELFKQIRDVVDNLVKMVENYLGDSFIVYYYDVAKYLSDDEFETLQGLVKKVQLSKSLDKEKKGSKEEEIIVLPEDIGERLNNLDILVKEGKLEEIQELINDIMKCKTH